MKLSETLGGLGWINMQKQYMLISQTANFLSAYVNVVKRNVTKVTATRCTV